ncbi:MAG: hypothetical protein KQH59_06445 [Desulfobulbaceae bacterium]|nr:hypothetical protein [Desulfobulbaceae bacterium]
MVRLQKLVIFTSFEGEGEKIIEINNHPQDLSLIESTNYFTSSLARGEKFWLSCNDMCFRLLLPGSYAETVEEMAACREVIVSRGVHQQMGSRESLELLFENDCATSWALHLTQDSIDVMPDIRYRDRRGEPYKWSFRIYTANGLIKTLPARYRKVKRLPCGRKWSDR